MRIQKEHAIGVIIDIQEKLYPHMNNNEELVKNTSVLIEGMKILGLPLLITQQYTKGLGDTIPQIKEAIEEYLPVEKVAFSCCDEPDFEDVLEDHAKPCVIIAGIESHVCVLQTAIDLNQRGFTVMVVVDCIASRKESDKQVALERMRHEGIMLTSYESILFELCRFADIDEFKAISKLVK